MKQEIAKLIDQALKDQLFDVGNSFPSIFSKDDVKHQLEEFGYGLITIIMEMKEEKTSRFMSLEGVEELEQLLIKALYKGIEKLDSEEVVDFSSACFSISYNNTIEIDNIDYLSDNITEVVDVAVAETLRDFFTPEEEEESVQEPQQ